MSISKIRFKGYDNSLERKSIGDITTSFSGGTPKSSNKTYYEGNIPFIRSGEIKSKQTELFISDDALKDSSAKMVEKGDILYALYGATSGEVAISQINGAINQAILAIKPNSGYSSEFIMNYLKKEKDNILEKYLQGGQGNLSAAIVKSIELGLPSLEEQTTIGSLFRTLDELLANYKDNIASYQSLKTTMLSKMFPKTGQTVPEIRLDGFEGEWKFSSLGEQANITKLAGFEFTNHVVYSDEGKIPAIRGLNVKNQKINLSDVKYIDKSDFSKLDRSKLIEDDLLFTYVGTVGEVARVPESVLWYLAPNVSRIRLNMALDSRFVLYQMASNRFKQKQIFPLIATSSQPALSMTNIRKFIISFTTLEEQQAIGAYFSNLDNLISAYQEKISRLETLKKKLLQDMFI